MADLNAFGFKQPETIQQAAARAQGSHPPRESYWPSASYSAPEAGAAPPTEMELVARTGAFRIHPDDWSAHEETKGKALTPEAIMQVQAVESTPRFIPQDDIDLPYQLTTSEYCVAVMATLMGMKAEVE